MLPGASPHLLLAKPGEVGLSCDGLLQSLVGGVPVRDMEMVLQEGLLQVEILRMLQSILHQHLVCQLQGGLRFRSSLTVHVL
jgi:hypothetical protein